MQKPSKFYLFVIILSVSLTMSYMRGRYSYSAVISCYSEFPDLRNLTLRGMQQLFLKLPRQTCREIKSSMTLEEEQLCDWTHMASAFFPRAREGPYAYVCIFTTSRILKKYAPFFNKKNFESTGQKSVCASNPVLIL